MLLMCNAASIEKKSRAGGINDKLSSFLEIGGLTLDGANPMKLQRDPSGLPNGFGGAP